MGEEAQEARSRRPEFDLHDRDLNCTCVCLEMQNESELAYMAHEGHAAGRVSSVLRPYQGHDMIAKSVGKGAKEGDTNHITQPSDGRMRYTDAFHANQVRGERAAMAQMRGENADCALNIDTQSGGKELIIVLSAGQD